MKLIKAEELRLAGATLRQRLPKAFEGPARFGELATAALNSFTLNRNVREYEMRDLSKKT